MVFNILFMLFCNNLNATPTAKASIVIPKEYDHLKLLEDGHYPINVDFSKNSSVIPVNSMGQSSFNDEKDLVWIANDTHITSFTNYRYGHSVNFIGAIYNRMQMSIWGEDGASFEGQFWGIAGGASAGSGECYFSNSARWMANSKWDASFSAFGASTGGGVTQIMFKETQRDEQIGHCWAVLGGGQLNMGNWGHGKFY
jgi:hypothetical protein